jgi:hypothetical protein
LITKMNETLMISQGISNITTFSAHVTVAS